MPGTHARPDVRPSKVSVKDWLSAAHAPETESTKKVMTRAERELRHSEPELMRRFDQVQAQGLTRKDAMTSAMGSTWSASNQRGTQEASSHPSGGHGPTPADQDEHAHGQRRYRGQDPEENQESQGRDERNGKMMTRQQVDMKEIITAQQDQIDDLVAAVDA